MLLNIFRIISNYIDLLSFLIYKEYESKKCSFSNVADLSFFCDNKGAECPD